MKLLRFGAQGEERPGLLDEAGVIRDLSGHLADLSGDALNPDSLAELAQLDTSSLPSVGDDVRIGAPVGGVGKVLAIGLNYADHAAETKSELPKEPLLFSKAVTSICGPNDPLIIPRGSVKTDWEVELAVVIGRRITYIPEAEALHCIAGYVVMNDVSERDYQKNRGGQFIKGKSFDSFGPIGPWLVTPDEVPDCQALNLWTEVNGKRHQDGTSADMVFSVAHLISYISRFMTLVPGDIITTGTPPGVGAGMNPPQFLKSGDRIRLGIEGLGEQDHPVVGFDD
ncbi:MAG: fumarylacetoacetate hydrolase family protein [Magnetovibrionaceae bacterium]